MLIYLAFIVATNSISMLMILSIPFFFGCINKFCEVNLLATNFLISINRIKLFFFLRLKFDFMLPELKTRLKKRED
jgi:hypothetical protein